MVSYEKGFVFHKLKKRGELPEFDEQELDELKERLETFCEKLSTPPTYNRFRLCNFCFGAYAGEVLKVIDTVDTLKKTIEQGEKTQ